MKYVSNVFINFFRNNRLFETLEDELQKAIYVSEDNVEWFFLETYHGAISDCFFICIVDGVLSGIYTYDTIDEAMEKEGFTFESLATYDCVIINN